MSGGDDLVHELERAVTVRATSETVFSHLATTAGWATWWGAGSRVDARPGGEAHVRYPNGVEAGGVVVEVDAPRRFVFTFGYASGTPFGAGATRVEMALDETAGGTRVRLRHVFADAAARDLHQAGWRFQLAVLANVAARAQHRDLEALADRFIAVWAERDHAARRAELAAIAIPGVTFSDEWAALAGADDLAAHIGAAQQHAGGASVERDGAVRHCQGTALVDWVVRGADGGVARRGTNVLELAPDGRIAGIVGLWR